MTNNEIPNLELRYKIATFLEKVYTKIKYWVLPMLVIFLLVLPVYAQNLTSVLTK